MLVKYQRLEIIDAELLLVKERQEIVLRHTKLTLPCAVSLALKYHMLIKKFYQDGI